MSRYIACIVLAVALSLGGLAILGNSVTTDNGDRPVAGPSAAVSSGLARFNTTDIRYAPPIYRTAR